jgi:CheY-like chemotaxis protein
MTQTQLLNPQSRILIVDDSRTDLTRARLLVSKESAWSVLTAEDGPTALQVIEENLPDLVVTDLQMPGMDGLELLQAIHRSHPEMPVLIMTAAGSDKIAMQCLNRGAASYVPKSKLTSMLSETIDRLLNQTRQNNQRERLMKRLQQVEYDIENDLPLIRTLIQDVNNLIRVRESFPEIDCFHIVTAIDEALTNAYYHGNLGVSSKLRESDSNEFYQLAAQRRNESPYRDRRIGVKFQFSEDDLIVEIQDDGNGFDVSSIPDPTEEVFLDRPHGRGILLMRTFMDDVQFHSSGTRVQMVKRVKQYSLEPVASE